MFVTSYGLPIDGFISEKQESTYIKNIERIFRASKEYKQFVTMIRQEYDGEYCRITNEHYMDVEVELHHYPLTLYEICLIATHTLLKQKQNILTTFDVANLVCKMHFDLKVGIIPIAKTIHEKVHNQDLLLPREWVIGDPWSLLEDQDFVIPEEFIIWKLKQAENFTLQQFEQLCKPVLWPYVKQ